DEALDQLRLAMRQDAERFAPFPLHVYEPERILGAGGFGVVFLCRDRRLDRAVVVKAMREDELDRDAAEVFREGAALERLAHPAIIRLFGAGYASPGDRARPYLVM